MTDPTNPYNITRIDFGAEDLSCIQLHADRLVNSFPVNHLGGPCNPGAEESAESALERTSVERLFTHWRKVIDDAIGLPDSMMKEDLKTLADEYVENLKAKKELDTFSRIKDTIFVKARRQPSRPILYNIYVWSPPSRGVPNHRKNHRVHFWFLGGMSGYIQVRGRSARQDKKRIQKVIDLLAKGKPPDPISIYVKVARPVQEISLTINPDVNTSGLNTDAPGEAIVNSPISFDYDLYQKTYVPPTNAT